jgi:protein tyrosine phosphatase
MVVGIFDEFVENDIDENENTDDGSSLGDDDEEDVKTKNNYYDEYTQHHCKSKRKNKGILLLESAFSEIIFRRLYFGCFPHRRHLVQWTDRILSWKGKTLSIVDLTTTKEKEQFHLYPPTMNDDEGIQIQYFSFPIEDNDIPYDIPAFKKFLEWLWDLYFRRTSLNNPLIIHCKGGHGRSAMVIAAFIAMTMSRETSEKLTLKVIDDIINVVSQLHHMRPFMHPKYTKQLCPLSSVQRQLLYRLFVSSSSSSSLSLSSSSHHHHSYPVISSPQPHQYQKKIKVFSSSS